MFVEVQSIQHKHSVGKLFQHLSHEIRMAALDKIYSMEELIISSSSLAVTEKQLLYFRSPRSTRLAKGSLLIAALSKVKIVVREIDLAFSNGDERTTRRGKRKNPV